VRYLKQLFHFDPRLPFIIPSFFLPLPASMEGLASLNKAPFQATPFLSSRPKTWDLPTQLNFYKRNSFSTFSIRAQVSFFWQIFYLFATFWGVSLWINLGLFLFLFWEFGFTKNGNR